MVERHRLINIQTQRQIETQTGIRELTSMFCLYHMLTQETNRETEMETV